MLNKYYAKLITHTINLSEITRNKVLEVQTKEKKCLNFDIMPTARESLDSKYSMCDPKVNLLSIISPRYLASLTTSIGVELMATVMLLDARLSFGGTRCTFDFVGLIINRFALTHSEIFLVPN